MLRLGTCFFYVIALLACGRDGRHETVDGGLAVDAAPASDGSSVGTDAAGGPCSSDDPRTEPPEPFVGYAGLRTRLVGAIDGARASLEVATYILEDAQIVESLERAHGRGVSVRVLVDGMRTDNEPAIAALLAAGVDVRTSMPEFEHYHPKILVADASTAWVMSANLNGYSMESERNHGVVLRDPRDVAHVRSVFEQDFGGPVADLECTRLVLSPLNSRERIEALIASAETDLRLQQLSLTDRAVRTRIAERAAAGVRVRVILADPAWIDSNTESARILREGGAEVRFLSVPENHAKLIVADEAAFVGSENLSWTSLERNREIGIVSDAPSTTGPLVEAFETDWAAARP